MTAEAAYHRCQEITRSRARNFYYGIRLLPPTKRAALCAVYAFARHVDDIGDDLAAPRDRRLEWLGEARARLGRVRALAAAPEQEGPAQEGDPVLLALADAARRYALPLDAFDELIDGVQADVEGRSYATFAELASYCSCVAGSIGRLALGVFGSSDPERATRLADALGVAMQLTNVLRDLREDAAAGRVYLPREDLDRFGCYPLPIGGGLLWPHERSTLALVRFAAERAERWFEHGLLLLPLLDRRSAACVAAMAGIYRRILGRIARQPELALERRVALPAWEKAVVATRSLAGFGGTG